MSAPAAVAPEQQSASPSTTPAPAHDGMRAGALGAALGLGVGLLFGELVVAGAVIAAGAAVGIGVARATFGKDKS